MKDVFCVYFLVDFGISFVFVLLFVLLVQLVCEVVGIFEDEDCGWIVLMGVSKCDLISFSQVQMQKLVVFFWEINLLVNWLIELLVVYLVVEGVKFICVDEEYQEWLDVFWYDLINKMDLCLFIFVCEMVLFGEQCWLIYVNEINGYVWLGYLDLFLIGEVIIDLGNVVQEIGVQIVKDFNGQFCQF